MLNTLFFGNPDVAVPFLERLIEKSNVLGVVTSPDKPAGRGHGLSMPAVKKAALSHGLRVFQPESLRDFSVSDMVEGRSVDVAIVVAYGKLIPERVFCSPRCGMVNVHFSLVPQYRGAGPVQWALINGDKETGVSVFQIEKSLDTGPVYLQKSVSVSAEDNVVVLRERLVREGLVLLDEFLERLENNAITPVAQKGEVSRAPLLKRGNGRIHWDGQTAGQIVNLIRGTYDWPGAYTFLRGSLLKIRSARVVACDKGVPGQIVGFEKGQGFLVRCQSNALLVLRVQPEGKKEMDAVSFWNGARLKAGDKFN